MHVEPNESGVTIGRDAMRAHLLGCGLSTAAAAALDGGTRPAAAVHEMRSALRCTLRPDLAHEIEEALAALPAGVAGYAVRTDDHKGTPVEVIARSAHEVPAAIRACWAAQLESPQANAIVVRPLSI